MYQWYKKCFDINQVDAYIETYAHAPTDISVFIHFGTKDDPIIGQKKYLRKADLKLNEKTKSVIYTHGKYTHYEDNLVSIPNCPKIKKIILYLTDQGYEKVLAFLGSIPQ